LLDEKFGYIIDAAKLLKITFRLFARRNLEEILEIFEAERKQIWREYVLDVVDNV